MTMLVTLVFVSIFCRCMLFILSVPCRPDVNRKPGCGKLKLVSSDNLEENDCLSRWLEILVSFLLKWFVLFRLSLCLVAVAWFCKKESFVTSSFTFELLNAKLV